MHPKLYEPKLKILKKGEKKSTRDGKESNNIWNRSIKKLEVGGHEEESWKSVGVRGMTGVATRDIQVSGESHQESVQRDN